MNKTKSLTDPHNVSVLWCNFPFLLAFHSGYGQVKQQNHTTVPNELSLSPIQKLSACSHKSEIFTVLWWKLPLSLHLCRFRMKVLSDSVWLLPHTAAIHSTQNTNLGDGRYSGATATSSLPLVVVSFANISFKRTNLWVNKLYWIPSWNDPVIFQLLVSCKQTCTDTLTHWVIVSTHLFAGIHSHGGNYFL